MNRVCVIAVTFSISFLIFISARILFNFCLNIIIIIISSSNNHYFFLLKSNVANVITLKKIQLTYLFSFKAMVSRSVISIGYFCLCYKT